jgi:hypothetical protein
MADSTPALWYSEDPILYLYTSLTAGSSHIITATSRLETILKANKIPFRAIDVATDEKARMLWGRRSRGKKLPGLVRFGMIVGVRTLSSFIPITLQAVILTVAGPRADRGVERIWRTQAANRQYGPR